MKSLAIFYFKESISLNYTDINNYSPTGFKPKYGNRINDDLILEIEFFKRNELIIEQKENKLFFEKIVKEYKEKVKRIIVLSLPNTIEYNMKLNEISMITSQREFINNVIVENNIEYFNLNAELNLESNLFYDHLHTNLEGSTLVSEVLKNKLFDCPNYHK